MFCFQRFFFWYAWQNLSDFFWGGRYLFLLPSIFSSFYLTGNRECVIYFHSRIFSPSQKVERKYLQLMKGNFSFTHWRNWKSNLLRDSLNSDKICVKLSDTPFHNCSSSSWTHSILLRSQLILYNLQILSTFSLWVDPLVSVPFFSVIFQLSPICWSNYTAAISNLEHQFHTQ